MHRKLLIEAFKQARKDSGETKAAGLSRYLATKIEKISNESYGSDALRGQHRKLEDEKENIKIRDFAANALSEYLGYDDFVHFNRVHSKKGFNLRSGIKKHKITIIAAILLILLFSIYLSVTKQCWMIWEEDHYLEVNFDSEKYNLSQLKLCNQDRLENFKQVNATCETPIFSPEGDPILWYGKNVKKELEYFSTLGLHPQTGKSLKPMTDYMKKKHLCNEHN